MEKSAEVAKAKAPVKDHHEHAAAEDAGHKPVKKVATVIRINFSMKLTKTSK